jgi:hypothetical protein
MTLRLDIDDALFVQIAHSLGKRRADVRAADITREALALFNWAARCRRRGLVLVCANHAGPVDAVTTPLLDQCSGQ